MKKVRNNKIFYIPIFLGWLKKRLYLIPPCNNTITFMPIPSKGYNPYSAYLQEIFKKLVLYNKPSLANIF